jgi:hypothetical protein
MKNFTNKLLFDNDNGYAYNSKLPQAGVLRFVGQESANSNLLLRGEVCAEKPRLRQFANRYRQW